MLIELYIIFFPFLFIFLCIGSLHKQIGQEIKRNIVMQRAVHSLFVMNRCYSGAECSDDKIKIKKKIIYIRKPKGGKDEGKDVFAKIVDGFEEKTKNNGYRKETGNI